MEEQKRSNLLLPEQVLELSQILIRRNAQHFYKQDKLLGYKARIQS